MITGDLKYLNASKQCLELLYSSRNPSTGLIGSCLKDANAPWKEDLWCINESGIGEGLGTYYEYLLKCSLYFGNNRCHEMWKNTLGSVLKYMAYWSNMGGELEDDMLSFLFFFHRNDF